MTDPISINLSVFQLLLIYSYGFSLRVQKSWRNLWKRDGLVDLSYKLISYEEKKLYTNITVQLIVQNRFKGRFMNVREKIIVQL